MKENNIVYEILVDSADDNGNSFIETKLYYNIEDAVAHFNETIEDFEKECLSSYEPDDYVIERDDNNYSWYEDGYYSANHFDVTLRQRKVL